MYVVGCFRMAGSGFGEFGWMWGAVDSGRAPQLGHLDLYILRSRHRLLKRKSISRFGTKPRLSSQRENHAITSGHSKSPCLLPASFCTTVMAKLNTARFHFEYKGHTIADLTSFLDATAAHRLGKPIIYLAGDSSLDNKYWVPSTTPPLGESLPVDTVPEIYNAVLQKPYPKADVAFWLNHFLGSRATTINTAVEASLLRERRHDLLDQDKFIRDHIRQNDILVVSVGANDIAMHPNAPTVFYMLLMAWLTPLRSIKSGTAWCLSHFVDLFKTQVESYLARLVAETKPRAVIVCTIYYPLEKQAAKQSSWADIPLRILGYNRSPRRLQTAITTMYEIATKKVQVPGVNIVPCALFETMDGKSPADYVERVEPSVEGGRKMATQLTELLQPLLTEQVQS